MTTPNGKITSLSRVAIAYHSGYGHTARQAQAVADGARSVDGTEVDLLSVEPLTDELWAVLDDADAIIFGCPTYIGSISGPFAAFKDATSKPWADNLAWKNKIAAGFTNSGAMSGDKLNTLIDLAVMAAQHGMVWVGVAEYPGWAASTGSAEDLNRLGAWLGAMAQSNTDQDADTAPPATDLRTAEALGRRVAEMARLHQLGTRALTEHLIAADATPPEPGNGGRAVT